MGGFWSVVSTRVVTLSEATFRDVVDIDNGTMPSVVGTAFGEAAIGDFERDIVGVVVFSAFSK